MQTTIENGWNVVVLPEKLTAKEALEFSKLIESGIPQRLHRWLADASRLRVIDSFAIGILVRILRDLRSSGGEFCIRDLYGSALEIFKRSGLTDLFLVKSGIITYAPKGALSIEDMPDFQMEKLGETIAFTFFGSMDSQAKVRNFKSKALLAMAECKHVLLDFGSLKSFTGAFAEEVLTISRLLRYSDGEIRICNVDSITGHLLKSYSIDGVIGVYDDRKAALQSKS